MKYVCLIPAYNPEQQLIEFVKTLKQHFEYIIIVNDGSKEDCGPIFDALASHCIILTHYVNQGKGRAIKTGLNKVMDICEGDSDTKIRGVVTVDADGQHSIEDILNIKKQLEEDDSAVVLGVRNFSKNNVPFKSRFGNTLTRFIMKWLCGLKISDTQTGLRGIPYRHIGMMCSVSGEKYEYETNCLISIHSAGVVLKEIPIQTIYEDGNSGSHFNPIRDSVMIYKVIFSYSMTSIFTTLLDFIVFTVCNIIGCNVWTSTAAGRFVASIFNFTVNKHAVFKSKGNTVRQFIEYLLLVVCSGTISAATINILQPLVPVDIIIIKIVVEAFLFCFNYYIQQAFIFTKNK